MEAIDHEIISRMFRYKELEFTYNFILLPSNLIQIVLVNSTIRTCYFVILQYEQLPEEIRDHFGDCQEVFDILKKTKGVSVDMINDQVNRLRVNFEKYGRYFSIDFDLKQRIYPGFRCKDCQKLLEIDKIKPECRFESFESKMKNRKIKDLQEQLKFAKMNIVDLAKRLEVLNAHFINKTEYSLDLQLNNKENKPMKVSYIIPVMSSDYSNELSSRTTSRKIVFEPYKNDFLDDFKIEENRVTMTRFKQDYSSVYFNEEVPTTGKTHVGLKVVKTNAHNICFGLAKEFRRRQMYTFQQKAAIAFKLIGGKNLFECGIQSGEKLPEIQEGEILHLTVDRGSGMLIWCVEGKFMLKREIVPDLRHIPLYIFVSMKNSGDQVEFI